MSPCPTLDEISESRISGKSVPKDTTKSPIMRGETPNPEAMCYECSTALSLEYASRAMPPMRTDIPNMISVTTWKHLWCACQKG